MDSNAYGQSMEFILSSYTKYPDYLTDKSSKSIKCYNFRTKAEDVFLQGNHF